MTVNPDVKPFPDAAVDRDRVYPLVVKFRGEIVPISVSLPSYLPMFMLRDVGNSIAQQVAAALEPRSEPTSNKQVADNPAARFENIRGHAEKAVRVYMTQVAVGISEQTGQPIVVMAPMAPGIAIPGLSWTAGELAGFLDEFMVVAEAGLTMPCECETCKRSKERPRSF